MMRHAVPMALLLVGVSASGVTGQDRPTDVWLTNPVDRATFDAYLEFFAYDAGLPFDARVSSTTTDEGVRSEALSFQSTPGMRVTARLYHPVGAGLERAPAVVLLHGGGARGKDAGYHVALSRVLARAGITTLALDMLHFGERADGFFTSFDELEKHERLYNNEPEYLQWVEQTVKDVSRAYDLLVDRGVAPSRIGLSGISRGGVVAAIAGAVETRFGAVALMHAGHFDYFEDGHRGAACPAHYIGRIGPRPLFILSAENDGDFLPDPSIRPMHRLAGDGATIRWTPGGHGATTDEDRAALIGWLRQHLE